MRPSEIFQLASVTVALCTPTVAEQQFTVDRTVKGYIRILTALCAAFLISASLIGGAIAQSAASHDAAPQFAAYPVSTNFRGKVALPDFKGRDKTFSIFRSRIIDGMRDGVNFAGKYSIITIGCGSGCRFYPVADLTNGAVKTFPLGGEEYGHLDLNFRVDSALVIAVWDDYRAKCFREAFKIDKGSFIPLGRSNTPRSKESDCSEPEEH